MPIKYVGKTTFLKGKTIWEIVGNLKNYGVGRIIIRNTFQRYPEPCYYKICRVESVPSVPSEGEETRRVNILMETVFRGRKFPELINLHRVSYKPDFRLIPKDEEEIYTRHKPIERETTILPKMMRPPPLLRLLVMQDMKRQGRPVEEPMMEVQYRQSVYNTAKIASDDETPTIKVSCDLGKPANPKLYEGVL